MSAWKVMRTAWLTARCPAVHITGERLTGMARRMLKFRFCASSRGPGRTAGEVKAYAYAHHGPDQPHPSEKTEVVMLLFVGNPVFLFYDFRYECCVVY